MKLFAYGTLRRRGRIEALVGRRLDEPVAATLEGYRLYDTGRGYPVILPAPGHRVQGVLWTIEEADLSYLDHYEGADEDPPYYFRRTVRVETAEGPVEACVYVGNPAVFDRLVPIEAYEIG
ncbi:AIG2 family protein [Thermaerobacter marianensis DSM 12885]|uniref:Putative gamma-glutamylcyclotransferase n=1 Tax=Thermaerobacter marianensis (strain ATCC 700841 / DSM 12885 / JCM 10246 / 7p75a) TaxID=644966 RepID=E6SKM0_THEM7|nr:gamma-glutamylcyclotransferase family protein [Thermaerobacter marianensis]ADU51228.1 AIG2 family protein [Thermaerobacter marianensis DSM 12885]